MKKPLDEEIAQMATLSARALEARHESLFGRKPETNHRQFLFRKIAWRIQADREGGLSEATKEIANAIAQEAPLRTRLIRNAAKRLAGLDPEQTATTVLPTGHDSRLPMPGGVIVKQFKGETLVVKVLADGFEFRDRRYKSLSAIALDLTGTKWNGFVFFGVDKERSHGRR
ncbi:MAG: DUF2924 domain-containing protein [Gammaproteobacteria bacterium]|nr:DUF2924 domain-containing protein [Gammaproteobacteria bacterium]